MEEKIVSVAGSEENNSEDSMFVAMVIDVGARRGIDCSWNEIYSTKVE
jgi:hypothetical protein